MDLFWAQRARGASEGTTSALKLFSNIRCQAGRGRQLLLKQQLPVASQTGRNRLFLPLWKSKPGKTQALKTIF